MSCLACGVLLQQREWTKTGVNVVKKPFGREREGRRVRGRRGSAGSTPMKGSVGVQRWQMSGCRMREGETDNLGGAGGGLGA